MKTLLLSLLVILVFTAANCRKQNDLEPNGLPPATQEGKNTFGFLLNGEPWSPLGFNGRANLSIDYDSQYKRGIFNIAAYRIIKESGNEQAIGFGLRDSLNDLSIPAKLLLGNKTLFGLTFITENCTYDYFDEGTYKKGDLVISKLDRTKRIISGTFNATLSKEGCGDTIKITNGRFDLKY
ncbi:hypothetical protein C3K47_19115 [Solitalea longa]|uniref:Lipoprotein n=1 Tax=Solitalea longa TaxID=2079460 RepID=A0A2S4ZWB4_9SPHI|nr:hypothetical protein [Solitalea longa]POY34660.1 hypothetical protein C3K47_19115 [Solitalea longa]